MVHVHVIKKGTCRFAVSTRVSTGSGRCRFAACRGRYPICWSKSALASTHTLHHFKKMSIEIMYFIYHFFRVKTYKNMLKIILKHYIYDKDSIKKNLYEKKY